MNLCRPATDDVYIGSHRLSLSIMSATTVSNNFYYYMFGFHPFRVKHFFCQLQNSWCNTMRVIPEITAILCEKCSSLAMRSASSIRSIPKPYTQWGEIKLKFQHIHKHIFTAIEALEELNDWSRKLIDEHELPLYMYKLRLRDTGSMDMWRCAHNQLKIYCEQLAKNCSTVYHFPHTI